MWELMSLSVSGQCVGGEMYCVGIDVMECIWPVCWWERCIVWELMSWSVSGQCVGVGDALCGN